MPHTTPLFVACNLSSNPETLVDHSTVQLLFEKFICHIMIPIFVTLQQQPKDLDPTSTLLQYEKLPAGISFTQVL
jgi:hypothetical protein